jgi:hypothetical protein
MKELSAVPLVLSCVVLVVLLTACDSGGSAPQEGITFQFRMEGDATGMQDFRAITSDPAVVAEARAQLNLPLEERRLFIIGEIDRGNGGHNLDWNWHFLPDRWSLAEAAIELCDGNAVLVSQAVDYWVDTVGQFCPWGARVSHEVIAAQQVAPGR